MLKKKGLLNIIDQYNNEILSELSDFGTERFRDYEIFVYVKVAKFKQTISKIFYLEK